MNLYLTIYLTSAILALLALYRIYCVNRILRHARFSVNYLYRAHYHREGFYLGKFHSYLTSFSFFTLFWALSCWHRDTLFPAIPIWEAEVFGLSPIDLT